MKFLKLGLTIILSVTFSLAALAHNPKGESFSLSGKITSIELKDSGGVITAVSYTHLTLPTKRIV